VAERWTVLILTLFLSGYLSFQKKQRTSVLWPTLVAANFAFYSKEPVFLMVGSLAVLHLVFTYKLATYKQKLMDFWLIFSAVIYIFVYYFLVFVHRGEHLYKDTSYSVFIQMAKNLYNFMLNDPFLFFLLVPLVCLRLYSIIKNRHSDYPLYDALFLSSFVYFSAFIVLNIFSIYYLLPVYVFAIPCVIFYATNSVLFNVRVIKFAVILTALLTIFSSMPMAVYLLSFYKYVPVNYNKMLDFMEQDLTNTFSEKPVILFDNLNEINDIELVKSLPIFFQFRGIDEKRVEVPIHVYQNNGREIYDDKKDIPGERKGDCLLLI